MDVTDCVWPTVNLAAPVCCPAAITIDEGTGAKSGLDDINKIVTPPTGATVDIVTVTEAMEPGRTVPGETLTLPNVGFTTEMDRFFDTLPRVPVSFAFRASDPVDAIVNVADFCPAGIATDVGTVTDG